MLGYPLIHIDEQFYLLVGDGMLSGSLPYVDVWDRKPIGLFLIYALARLGGGEGIWQYQLLALISVVATALVISRIASRFASPLAAIGAAMIYIVWLNIGGGSGGQAPVFYNLPMAGAALLLVRALEVPRGARLPQLLKSGGLTMLLVGVAMQIKYTAVFEGIGFGLVLLWSARGERMPLPQFCAAAAVWIACALLPTAIALAAYGAMGALNEFMFANFYSIFHRSPATSGEVALRLLRLAAFVLPLFILAAAAARQKADGTAVIVKRLVWLWLAVASAGVLAFGTYFRHYALPVFLPGAIASAVAFDIPGHIRRAAVATLLAAIFVGQVMLVDIRRNEGSREMLDRMVAAMNGHPGCLLVFKGHPILYHFSDRCRLSRFWMPAHLDKANEAQALGIDVSAETRRILSRKPGLIVTTSPIRQSDNLETRAILDAALARDYKLVYQEKAGRTVHQLYALKPKA